MEENKSVGRVYILQQWDMLLIQAAIEFGDFLIGLPEASEKNRSDILRFQDVLRRVPEVTSGIEADYGLAVLNLRDDFHGVNRDWWIEIRPDGNIEIHSLYAELPDRDECKEDQMEDWFRFCPGEPSHYHPAAWERWAEEVSDPCRWLRKPDQYLEIDTEFRVVGQRMSESFYDYRVHRSKAELEGTDYIEIGPGNFTGRYWQEGFVFVDEESFGIAEGILRKHFPKYDPWGVTGLSKETGLAIAAEWRSTAAALPSLSLEDARAALNPQRFSETYYDGEIAHFSPMIAKMFIQLADALEEFYRFSDRVCIIGV